MKKVLLIIGIVIVVLLAAVAATPFLFKGKILEIAKREVNNMLTAEVDFNDDAFRVSIFRTFPNLSVQFGDLRIVGTGQFANDTLLSVKRLSATVDIMTLIKSQPIGIIDVTIEKPRIRALVAADSAANFDIMKPSDEVVVEDTTSSSFAMKLNHIQLIDGYIYYNDIPGNMTGIIDGLNTTISGDFTANSTIIQTIIDMQKVNFVMGGVPYAKDLHFNLDAGIEADFANGKYTLKDNKMQLNALELAYNGWLAFVGDDIDMDFTFKTMKTDFSSILSLVPGVFMEGFENIKTSGKLALEGSVKGLLAEKPESYPAFNLALLVEDGSFQYPDLPKAVTNIQMDLLVDNQSNQLDNMTIDLKKFTMNFAQNPLSATFFMKTPMSDPFMKASFDGTLDISSLKDFIPMTDMSMSGTIIPRIEFAGKLSDIEKENYNAIHALGSIVINNFKYTDKDFPKGIAISAAKLAFSPQYVNLEQCDMKFGESDLALQGKLENFLGYALANETIRGSLNVKSNYFNAADVLGESTTTTETADSSPAEIIEIPNNVDFVCNINFGKLIYDTYDIENLTGKVTLKNSKADLQNLSMNMLGGNLGLNGHYATPANQKPEAKLDLNIRNFDIAKTFKTFVTVQKLAPIAENLSGSFSTKLNFSSLLDNDFSPVLSSINGLGEFNTSTLTMTGTSFQNFAVNELKQQNLKEIVTKNLAMFFTITNGNIEVKPFTTNFNNYKALIQGSANLDQTMNFTIATQIPSSVLGKGATSTLASLEKAVAAKGIDASMGENIDVNFLIGGTVTSPKISAQLGTGISNTLTSVKDQVTDMAKQKLADEQARLQAEAQAKVDAAKQKAEAEVQAKKQELEDKAKAEAQKQTDAAKEKAAQGLKNVLKK
ncbi:MAG: hypothetical protein FWC39_04305 [Bacteroidetes bacterium]|nr:hypothetical protein [Bacteroidota bacterium]